MSAPAFRAVSTILAIQNGTADGTLTLPTHQTNDILIMHTWRRSLTNTVLTPSGWTLIAGPWNSTAERHYVFGRRAASGSETNPLLDWSATSGDLYALCVSYSGAVTTGTAWEVVGATQTGTSNNPSLTGITTLTADALVVVCFGYGDNNNAANGYALTATDPAAFAEHFVLSAVGADGTIGFSEAARATAGATGNIAVAGQTTTAGDGWGALVIALTGIPGQPSDDVLVRFGSVAQTNGSGLITTNFTASGAATVFGGMMMHYYADIVQGMN